MKGLFKYELAAAMIVATDMPAMARSWDVCLTTADQNASSETADGLPLFFSAVANVYPNGTFLKGTGACQF